MRKHFFITGPPRSGKTTLISKFFYYLKKREISVEGFFTPEVTIGGKRVGFDIELIGDGRIPLARKKRDEWSIRFGSYNINPEAKVVFQEILPSMTRKAQVLILDEIGPMELYVEGAVEFFRHTLSQTRPPIIGVVHRNIVKYDRRIYEIVSKNILYNTLYNPPQEILKKAIEWLETVL